MRLQRGVGEEVLVLQFMLIHFCLVATDIDGVLCRNYYRTKRVSGASLPAIWMPVAQKRASQINAAC